jgi:hypothetical protein
MNNIINTTPEKVIYTIDVSEMLITDVDEYMEKIINKLRSNNKLDFLWTSMVGANLIDCTTNITKKTDSGTYSNGIEYETFETDSIDDDIVILNSLCLENNKITFNTKKNQEVIIDDTSEILFHNQYVSVKCSEEKFYLLKLKMVVVLDLYKLYNKYEKI